MKRLRHVRLAHRPEPVFSAKAIMARRTNGHRVAATSARTGAGRNVDAASSPMRRRSGASYCSSAAITIGPSGLGCWILDSDHENDALSACV